MNRRNFIRTTGLMSGTIFFPGLSACLADEDSFDALGDLPLGVSTAPSYALTTYDPTGQTIPSNAIDSSGFDNLLDWLESMEAEGRPGRIGSGTYALHGIGKRVITQSIYGYDSGAGQPVLIGGDGDALYIHGNNVSFQFLHWRDWACPLIRISDWHYDDLQFSSSRTNYEYFSPKSAPFLDADWSHIRVLDCTFERCDTGVAFLSDKFEVADIHVGRNQVFGGKGFISLICRYHRGIYLYQNSISSMRQGTAKGQHVGSIFVVGYNASQERGRCGSVYTEYNECRDVISEHAHDKINGSVFADIRQATGWTCRGNIIEGCKNSVGHADCNALYGKSYDVLIAGNLFDDNGANTTESHPGSEGAHITLKGGDAEGNSYAKTIIKNNIFRSGTINSVSAILVSHEAMIIGNRFEDYIMNVPSNSYGSGIIRSYSGGPIYVGQNQFDGCGNVDGAAKYCYLVAAEENITIEDIEVDFDNNSTKILRGVAEIINSTNTLGQSLENAD